MSELARVAGPLAAAGLAVLIGAPRREFRLAGLGAWALGSAVLAYYLAPHGHRALLAAAGLAGLVLAAAAAALLLRWPWLLALAALACVPARIQLTVGSTQASLLVPMYGVAAAAALALLWQLWRGDERARELGPLALPLALFVFWGGLSLAWSEDLRQGAIELLAFYLPFGLIAVALARLPWRADWLRALFGLLVGMAILFALIGVYQYETRNIFWNPKVLVANAYAPFYRVNSVFWDPSIYGRFLVVAILACLVPVVLGAPRRVSVGAAAAIVVAWIGLVLSFSQSSFVALVCGVGVVAWFAWGRRTLALIGVVALVGLVAAVALPSVRHHSLNSASGGRFKLVKNGIAIAVHHPLQGVGIGGFKKAYARRTHLSGNEPKAAASHDTPVTVAAETGAIGLVLFVWLLLAAFVLAFRTAGSSAAGRLALSLAAVLVAIGVHSLFYNAFFEDPVTWGALALLPLAAAARTREALSERQRRDGVPPRAAVVVPPAGRSRAEAG
ncbi:MAG TPA: O-antigen ligase family protein [Gaiellaceae bacterium]